MEPDCIVQKMGLRKQMAKLTSSKKADIRKEAYFEKQIMNTYCSLVAHGSTDLLHIQLTNHVNYRVEQCSVFIVSSCTGLSPVPLRRHKVQHTVATKGLI